VREGILSFRSFVFIESKGKAKAAERKKKRRDYSFAGVHDMVYCSRKKTDGSYCKQNAEKFVFVYFHKCHLP